ncbi:MAG TPA: DUF5919 domain-containing protein [Micromonosporaceae bacterium]
MTTIQKWSGRETRALREAMRMSIREFASYIGVSERTVSKWEADEVSPRPEMQAALDTALKRSSGEVRQRFNSAIEISDGAGLREDHKRPRAAVLACEQVARTRRALNLTPDEFAKVLSPVLGWEPDAHMVKSWETTVVPPGDVLAGLTIVSRNNRTETVSPDDLGNDRLADVTRIYTSRMEFLAHMPPDRWLRKASEVRAMGLSLNLLCQHYPDRNWLTLVERGTKVRCLFLDPTGSAIRAREVEEGFPQGQLSALTSLNIETIKRVRDRLPGEAQDRIQIAVYDQTIRFNVVLVDDLCIAQPYLPQSRGVDCPTFVIERQAAAAPGYTRCSSRSSTSSGIAGSNYD